MEVHKKCFKSSLQPSNRLDFSFQNVYNKGTKFSVVLAISPLVVRRTFYLIVNDRDLALKIRLLFSTAIQLLVVDYIIQPLVVNVNGFLQNFKIFFNNLLTIYSIEYIIQIYSKEYISSKNNNLF